LFHIFSVSLEDQTLSFRHYTTADGLPDNQIIGLLTGNDGKLWISTVKGISCLDQITNQVKSFDTYDGLQSNEFSQGSFHKGPSGKLYFGGIHGLNAFFPEDIRDIQFQSRVYLTGMKLFYTDVGIQMPDDLSIPADEPMDGIEKIRIQTMEKKHYTPISFFDIGEIELSHKQNVLTFDFAAPEFFKPSKILYLCRMEGFEENWNNVGNAGRITYTNLDPGEYILKVQARNGDQVAAREELRLNISITPPLWTRPWFMILSILLLLLLVVTAVILIIRKQNRKERMEAEREKEMLELQLKSIRSQINPHFTFNAINSIGSFIYSNDPDKTYDYFTKFSKLIRHTLQSTDRLYVPLEEEIDFIRTYLELESVRFKKKFDFTVEVDKRIDLKVMVPKMILHTHTENAIKHGLINKDEEGRLEIRVEQQDNALVFIVRDNGIGRLKSAGISKYSTHRGLKIIEQLFDLHFRIYHQKITQQITDLYDENNNPSGTEVRIMYPVPEEMEIN
jgi:two-component sensor histidine kinase